MFAQPAALLFLVAETLRDREPLQRLAKFALMRGDDARERRRQLGPQRDFALAFVGEIEKLRRRFPARFFSAKARSARARALPFDEAVAPADLAPVARRWRSEKRSRRAGNRGNPGAVA